MYQGIDGVVRVVRVLVHLLTRSIRAANHMIDVMKSMDLRSTVIEFSRIVFVHT